MPVVAFQRMGVMRIGQSWRAIFIPIGWGLSHPEAIGWAQSIVNDGVWLEGEHQIYG